MQLGRCPVCHSRIHLEAMVQDESGRELMGLVVRLDAVLAVPLVSYLGLFRSSSRDLANDKALKLAKEVLAFGEAGLVEALTDTVEAIRAKQVAGEAKPLSNHNYLRAVLKDKQGRVLVTQARETGVIGGQVQAPKTSKTHQALCALSELMQ